MSTFRYINQISLHEKIEMDGEGTYGTQIQITTFVCVCRSLLALTRFPTVYMRHMHVYF